MFFQSYWKSLSPLTRNMAVFALINIIGINLCLKVLSPAAYAQTVFTQIIYSFLVLGETGHDSWDAMGIAFSYLRSHHDPTVYSEIFFNNKIKFQYPLSSLFPFILLDWTIPESEWKHALKLINYIAVAFNILFVTKIFNLVLFRCSISNFPHSNVDALTRNFIVICLGFTFYPVVKAVHLGQIQVWLNSLFALVTWLWLKKSEKLAGAVTAMMTLIKPQYLNIFIWSLIRKKYQFFVFFSIVFVTGLLGSLLAFGFENNFEYFKVLSFISRHGESFKNNHSVNGLVNRLIFNGENLEWKSHDFPPFNYIVYISTLASSLILISLALRPKSSNRIQGGIIDFLIVALSSTMASPIAWEHHYGILLTIYAVLLPLSLMESTFSRTNILLLAFTYVFCSNYFNVTDLLANIPILNIFQSYLFIAAFVLLIYLYRLRSLLFLDSKSMKDRQSELI